MKILLELTRFYLSLAVCLSAIFSYLVRVEAPTMEILFPAFGVLLLALGSSALNQIQEIHFDAKMKRTSNRPLVAKRISLPSAFIISFFLIISSFIIIYFSLGIIGIAFFAFTFVIYNIVYTYLKRISYWALVLGSFLGVIAPSIGWLIAGGLLSETRFIFLFLLYFIWQIPHFWLLMLMNGNDYKKAGFPTLKDKIGTKGLSKIIAIWYLLTIFIALFLVYISNVYLTIWILCIAIATYSIYSAYLLTVTQKTKRKFFKIRFMELNTFVLLIMIFLAIDNLAL